ncbi:hypothetical protein LLG46_03800 [bacterium]|nr:hypothetical protein [bacterium]
MNDTISIVKPNGRRIDSITAFVDSNMVFMEESDLAGFPFEERDRIIRRLPNGCEEVYLVMDRGYNSSFAGEAAHYQAKVRKESAVSFGRPSAVTYNLNGAASRVNVNSIDSSVNVVNAANDDSFQQLRALIEQNISEPRKRAELLDHVNQLKNTSGGADYKSRYTAFIAAAADHMTLIAPFIPFLTGLLK